MQIVGVLSRARLNECLGFSDTPVRCHRMGRNRLNRSGGESSWSPCISLNVPLHFLLQSIFYCYSSQRLRDCMILTMSRNLTQKEIILRGREYILFLDVVSRHATYSK